MMQSTSKKVRRGRIFPEIQWSEEQKQQWHEDNEALRNRCFPIFERLKKELMKTHYNWYIAIEPKSEDYFIAKNDLEVINNFRKKYHNSPFYLFKINETGAAGTI